MRARLVLEASSKCADLLECALGEMTMGQKDVATKLIASVWINIETILHGEDHDELIKELNEFAKELRCDTNDETTQ